ncbi:oxidoreductase [Baekduia soli]|uniref:Oxidoreductase n=1 Tax=Baekduia soli TaxID=496014 RepID=A0A5B8U9Q2_9ACTN|nr:ferredoxin reductase [Baekduia soli]QEC49727.1 oxidoreductase [Baekduia soli]
MAPARIAWRVATVVEVVEETPHARTLVLDVPGWPGHVAGQHVDVRLTAPDGYQAQRSYSIASGPEAPHVALTVARIDDGEVSPYLAGEVAVGDGLELRGPIGGHFTWTAADGGPLLLVAGGSGLVPLMAMLRHRAAAGSGAEARLLLSARTAPDVLYAAELAELAADPALTVTTTLTRSAPDGWGGRRGRVDAAMLDAAAPAPAAMPRTYVCGPTAFVERVADLLVARGHAAGTIHAERFGPTGG